MPRITRNDGTRIARVISELTIQFIGNEGNAQRDAAQANGRDDRM